MIIGDWRHSILNLAVLQYPWWPVTLLYLLLNFYGPQVVAYILLLESVLLTLEVCLPNFKLASGGQLGDESRVLDVENSTGTGLGFFNIFEKNRSSQIPLRSSFDRRVKDNSIVQYRRENAIMADARNNNAVPKFLASLWTQLCCTATKHFPHIHVFWSQIERPHRNSSSGELTLIPISVFLWIVIQLIVHNAQMMVYLTIIGWFARRSNLHFVIFIRLA